MCAPSIVKFIADPVGIFDNSVTSKIADPLGLTDTWVGDPADVLGKRADKLKQEAADVAKQQQTAVDAQSNAAAATNPQNPATPAAAQAAQTASAGGVNPSAGGGSTGYSTLLTGLNGVDPASLQLGRTSLGGATTLLGA